jgi:hypothetical protein
MNRALLRFALIACLCLLGAPTQAATRYVTDRVLAELHLQPDPASPVVATLPTGTPLQVVPGAAGDYTQVIAPGERRGWIATQLLSTEQPALATLLRLRDEQARTRAELERIRAEKAEAKLWSLVLTALGALVIGFGLGVLWLDHRIRIRHGGFRI